MYWTLDNALLEGRTGGLFKYFDRHLGLLLTFLWDGAGITKSGNVIILEEERPPFNTLHIQGHLARLSLMTKLGESVEKLVWLVPPAAYIALDKIVHPWVKFDEKITGKRLASIEYRDFNGKYLGENGVSSLEGRVWKIQNI